MRCVDEAARALRVRRRPVRRIDVDAVVAPVSVAGERRDRHHLDRGHAELAEFGQPLGSRRRMCPTGRTCPRGARRARAHRGTGLAQSRSLHANDADRPRGKALVCRAAVSASTGRAALRRRRGRRSSRAARLASDPSRVKTPSAAGLELVILPVDPRGDAPRRGRPHAELGACRHPSAAAPSCGNACRHTAHEQSPVPLPRRPKRNSRVWRSSDCSADGLGMAARCCSGGKAACCCI